MANYDHAVQLVNTDAGDETGPTGAAPSGGGDIGPCFAIRKTFAASGTDITIYASNAPCKFRILDSFVIFTTAIDTKTATLRTATGGGGTACSSAMTSGAAASLQRNALTTATQTIASGGSLYLNKSDAGLAGEVVIFIQPEQ